MAKITTKEIDRKIQELQVLLDNVIPDENISEQFKTANLLKKKREIRKQITQLQHEKRECIVESIYEVLASNDLTISEGIAVLNEAIATIPKKAKCSI